MEKIFIQITTQVVPATETQPQKFFIFGVTGEGKVYYKKGIKGPWIILDEKDEVSA